MRYGERQNRSRAGNAVVTCSAQNVAREKVVRTQSYRCEGRWFRAHPSVAESSQWGGAALRHAFLHVGITYERRCSCHEAVLARSYQKTPRLCYYALLICQTRAAPPGDERLSPGTRMISATPKQRVLFMSSAVEVSRIMVRLTPR